VVFIARKVKLEKIESVSKEIEALKKEYSEMMKLYKQQEQKERTRRLCSRGGYLESRLPETIALTDNQYKVFLESTLMRDKGRSILDWVKSKDIVNIGINPETQNRQVTLGNGEIHDI